MITYRDLSHSRILTTVGGGLRGSSIGGCVALSRGVFVASEVVDHFGVQLLHSLGLRAARVTTTATTGTATPTGISSLGSCGGLRLGLGLSITYEKSIITDGHVEGNLRDTLTKRLGSRDFGSVRGIDNNLDLLTLEKR